MVARRRNDAVALGRVIEAMRRDLDLSRPDLATLASLSYPYLYEIEKGTKYPSPEAFERIAAALEVSQQDLKQRQAEIEETLPEEVIDTGDVKPPRVSPSVRAAPRLDSGPAGADPSDLISSITRRVLEQLEPTVRAAVVEALKDSS
jgi:transcriptional regulator with XRE-family HTH domain